MPLPHKQEALLTRFFKPHQVKKLMQEQREATAAWGELKVRELAAGRRTCGGRLGVPGRAAHPSAARMQRGAVCGVGACEACSGVLKDEKLFITLENRGNSRC